MDIYKFKMVYRKSHPLSKVYDLQHEIVKNGGAIKRDSDLLAYFERRSYNPDLDPFEILDNLAWSNSKWVSKNYAKTQRILDYEMMAYTSGEGENTFERMIRTQRVKKGDKLWPGYSYKIPPIRENDFKEGGYFLSDNEYVMKRGDFVRIIILNPIYKEIFPLIVNWKDNWPHLNQNKNHVIIAAIILSFSILVSSFILAQSFRYEVNSFIRFDKWTGKSKVIEINK